MSSTVLVPVLDNNYPPKSRSVFISVLLHMLASSCLRLMCVFAYYLRVLKMLGNYCLRVELGHCETIIILTNGERICSKLNFLTSLLPYFLTSLLLYCRRAPRTAPQIRRSGAKLGVSELTKRNKKKTHSAPILFTLSVSRASARSMALVWVNASKKKKRCARAIHSVQTMSNYAPTCAST